MSKLEQALALANKGFYVFPCEENGKRPAIKDFPNKATRDPKQIEEWFANTNRNIGISTSKFGDNGALIVVDVDCKNGKNGNAELFRLEIKGGEFPRSMEQTTPSGGKHIIYQHSHACKQGVNVLGDGLDIRSNGGYIVGPGSEINGVFYKQIDSGSNVAPAPNWLVQRLGRATEKTAVDSAPVAGIDPKRAEQRAKKYLKTAPLAIEGSGGDQTTFKVAAKLKNFGCTEAQTLQLMHDQWNDRCTPPWPYEDMADKVRNAFKYGAEQPGCEAPEIVFKDYASTEETKGSQATPPSKFPWYSNTEFLKRPRPKWIIRDVLPEAELGVIYGESGAGKSFVALDIAMAISRGIEWNGKKVKQGRVVYICAEGAGGFRNRLEAYERHNKIIGQELPFHTIPDTPNLLLGDDVDEIGRSILTGGNAALIIIDTFAQATPGANENTSEDMGRAIRNCKALHKTTGALVILVHHAGKDLSKGQRGWSGIKGAADAQLEVSRSGEVRKITVKKQKDGEDGVEWGFRLDNVLLSMNDEETVSSCVVAYTGVPVKAKAAEPKGKWEKVIADVWNESNGQDLATDELVAEAMRRTPKEPGVKDRRKFSFRRAIQTLSANGLIRVHGDSVLP